jgi:hypothetical protein
MKNMLLASVAFVLVSATASLATSPSDAQAFPSFKPAAHGMLMLADSDGDGGGGDDHGGGGGDDGADHDSNDDHGGANSNDHDDDDGDDAADDSNDRKKGGRKARVPGGSGCDSASDRAEHPECSAG